MLAADIFSHTVPLSTRVYQPVPRYTTKSIFRFSYIFGTEDFSHMTHAAHALRHTGICPSFVALELSLCYTCRHVDSKELERL